MVKRILNIANVLGISKSSFLFGPRGVGKTYLVEEFLYRKHNSFKINLLDNETFNRYLLNPSFFKLDIEEQVKKHKHLIVFIDEVQKLPALLDMVHLFIENHKGHIQFLLTGSSARKLKRGGANLLAGRALTLKLHPFSSCELELKLERVLQFGSLPAFYLLEENPVREIKSYVETYLQEEIRQESLVRRYDGFLRFLEFAAQMNAEPVNFSQVARDAGVHSETARDYYSILEDTLLAFRINAWTYSVRKQLRHSPKFYFFDCGILNSLRGELNTSLKRGSFRYGKLFETFLIQETIHYNDYFEKEYKFYYWRTNSGMEVDIILSRGANDTPIVIEIKSSSNPTESDLKSLKSFGLEQKNAKLICLCQTPNPYTLGKISVLPWLEGLKKIFTEKG